MQEAAALPPPPYVPLVDDELPPYVALQTAEELPPYTAPFVFD